MGTTWQICQFHFEPGVVRRWRRRTCSAQPVPTFDCWLKRKRTLGWKPPAATRVAQLSSFLSLNFIPREHEITLIVVRTLEIMKMYSLQNTDSPHLNWKDRGDFHLLRVQGQHAEAFKAPVLTLGFALTSPGKLHPRPTASQTRGEMQVWVLYRAFQATAMSAEVEKHCLVHVQ